MEDVPRAAKQNSELEGTGVGNCKTEADTQGQQRYGSALESEKTGSDQDCVQDCVQDSSSSSKTDAEKSQSDHIANRPQSESGGLERTQTSTSTALSVLRLRGAQPNFTHPLAQEKTNASVIVDFDGKEDPYRPMNWSFKKKSVTTVLYGLTAMASMFGSSVYAPAVDDISQHFKIGTEVSLLGVSLLLFGFGLGPCLWGPLSEVYGRRLAVFVPFFVSAMFAFGGGAAKDVQTLMICRFFQGFFGSAPATNTGGVLGDLWSAEVRGVAMQGYAIALVGGPTIGPIVGGAIIVTGTSWRWTQYVTGIFMMVILAVDVVILDESYAPSLLVSKARRLRHETGNWALHAKHEEWNVSLKELANKYLIRAFQLLGTPICFLMAVYASFCYGIMYAALAAFPIEFVETRGWNALIGELPFVAMLLGIFIGAGCNLINQKFYIKRWRANDCRAVPEARLPPMMVGSVVFTGGLFMFAWSSGGDVFWLVPCIGIVLMGFGCFTIFQAALNYLIDTFQKYAASAIAANTFLRSVFAGAFPLFIPPMLHNIGIDWGISVFGFVAAIMIPIPFLFYVYGKRVRARGVWSRESV